MFKQALKPQVTQQGQPQMRLALSYGYIILISPVTKHNLYYHTFGKYESLLDKLYFKN